MAASLASIRSFFFELVQVSICFLRLMEISVILNAQCRLEEYDRRKDNGGVGDRERFMGPGGFTSTTLGAFTFQSPEVMPEWEREEPDCLVFSTASPLEEECAREILSLFMLSICMRVAGVRGETHQELDLTMKNTTFTGLAEKIVQAGLAQSTDYALLYVIPAFAKFGLLPRRKA